MTALLLLFFVVLGAMLASFAGVISERINTGESWTRGRSRCNSCSRTLSGSDLVPVLSWLGSKGRCRTCKARVPYRYALSELALGTLFGAAYLREGLTVALVLFLICLFILTVIVLYDLRHTIVPFSLSMWLIACAVLYAFVSSPSLAHLGRTALIAGLIGLGFLLLHFLSKGRAMGLGDAPVAFALSFLAADAAVAGLLFSFWIGAAIGIGILVGHPKGHRMGIEVPFVPFLAAGYLLALFTQWNPFL